MANKIKYSRLAILLAIIFVFDQALLPMFHILEVPIKPSYLILAIVPIIANVSKSNIYYFAAKRQLLWSLTSPIIGIALLGLVGQLYLMTLGEVLDPYEAFKMIMVYTLMVLAFSFGQRVPEFPLRSILWMFYGAIATVLLLSIAGEHVPWLANLWWKTDEVIQERLIGNEMRPTPFGDGSMIISVLLFLFIVVSVRLGYLKIPKYHVILSITLVICTAFILASRNQIIAASIVTVPFALGGRSNLVIKLIFLFTIIIGLSTLFIYSEDIVRKQFSYIDFAYKRFENLQLLDTVRHDKDDTILRPLIKWDLFIDRFSASPIFGTGFSRLSYYPFNYLHFHNDWFYVWATSGIIGGMLLFLWMFRIYKALGPLVLIPFFLPGLTNSFILHYSAVLIYCFMLGVLVERKNLKNYSLQRRDITNQNYRATSAISPNSSL